MLKPWIEAQPRLVEIAAGRAHADLVIRGGAWVNVHTREVIEGTDMLGGYERTEGFGLERRGDHWVITDMSWPMWCEGSVR